MSEQEQSKTGAIPLNAEKIKKVQDQMAQKLSDETGVSVEEVKKDLKDGLDPKPMTVVAKFKPEVPSDPPTVPRATSEIVEGPEANQPPPEEAMEAQESAAPAGTPSFLKAAYETSARLKAEQGVVAEVNPPQQQRPQQQRQQTPRPQVDVAMMHPVPSISKADRGVLDRIEVDLSHIEVIEANKLQRASYMEAVLRSDAAYQVVALRSGFSCGMSGLTFLDKDSLRNSNLDPYNERKRLYQITHRKMVESSVGQMTFSEFLKITAFDDLETLLFGIYCQTYPNATEFTVTCGKCGKPSQVQVHPMSFINVHDEDVYLFINDIVARKQKPMELLGQSLVHSHERILLPETKIVVDIRTPSLEDHLETMARYNDQTMAQSRETFGCMIYIDQVLVPNLQAMRASGKAVYSKLENFDEAFHVVCGLRTDGEVLNAAINRRERKFAVTFRIKSVPCSGCKEDMGEIPIDVENLLYFQMEESRRRAEEDPADKDPVEEAPVEGQTPDQPPTSDSTTE